MYDYFEIEIVVEYSSETGDMMRLPFDGTAAQAEEHIRITPDAYRWFYTIYGHKPGGGTSALIDADSSQYTYAFELCDWFNSLLDAKKKFEKIKELT